MRRRDEPAAPREVPDEVLVMATLVGDIAAFDQLVRRYRSAVVRVAEYLVSTLHERSVQTVVVGDVRDVWPAYHR